MLTMLDVLLTIVHVAITLFNLLGWISKRSRKAHFIAVLLTATSWFVLGIWFGIGYCPFTDWQWQVKEKLGERHLPNNFIEYIAESLTGYNLDSALVDTAIAIGFTLAALLSFYMNFILPRLKKHKQVRLR